MASRPLSVIEGSQVRNETETILLTGQPSYAAPPTFQGMAPPTVGWTLPLQSSVKTTSYRCVQKANPIWAVPQLRLPLPDNKKTNQHKMNLVYLRTGLLGDGGLLSHSSISEGLRVSSTKINQLHSRQGINHPGCVFLNFYFCWNIIIYLDLLQQVSYFLKTDILLFCKFAPRSHLLVLCWLINRTAD